MARGQSEKVKHMHKDGKVKFFTRESMKFGGPRRNGFKPVEEKVKVKETVRDEEVESPEILDETVKPKAKPGPKKKN